MWRVSCRSLFVFTFACSLLCSTSCVFGKASLPEISLDFNAKSWSSAGKRMYGLVQWTDFPSDRHHHGPPKEPYPGPEAARLPYPGPKKSKSPVIQSERVVHPSSASAHVGSTLHCPKADVSQAGAASQPRQGTERMHAAGAQPDAKGGDCQRPGTNHIPTNMVSTTSPNKQRPGHEKTAHSLSSTETIHFPVTGLVVQSEAKDTWQQRGRVSTRESVTSKTGDGRRIMCRVSVGKSSSSALETAAAPEPDDVPQLCPGQAGANVPSKDDVTVSASGQVRHQLCERKKWTRHPWILSVGHNH